LSDVTPSMSMMRGSLTVQLLSAMDPPNSRYIV
jgi:hypothetical protein